MILFCWGLRAMEPKFQKNINSVRGVFKILLPRNSLPEEWDGIRMSPEDEFTLFFYIGMDCFITTKFKGIPFKYTN